jgi:hypothetical protein
MLARSSFSSDDNDVSVAGTATATSTTSMSNFLLEYSNKKVQNRPDPDPQH